MLILTLYSGEQEYSDSTESIRRQTYRFWEHKVFRSLPNVEAHQTLYKCIQESTEEFDLFIKLDADMVLTKSSALASIVDVFLTDRELDHAVFAVLDWLSRQAIMGLHAYSNRVTWDQSTEDLFVDPKPRVVGHRRLLWKHPAPVADHMPNPSWEHAFLFGYHRALKIVQRGRTKKNIEHSMTQWRILQGVWESYKSSQEPRRAAALLGAEKAFCGKDRNLANKSQSREENVMRELHSRSYEQLYGLFYKRWETGGATRTWRLLRWTVIPRWVRPFIRLGEMGSRLVDKERRF